MQYLLLIYANEVANAQQSEAEMKAQMDAYYAFTNKVREDGVYVGGEALHPTSSATTVRVANGKTVTTDGPFAETKEQLGGYYLLDCENLDAAIEYAAMIPDAEGGSVEIRPIMSFE